MINNYKIHSAHTNIGKKKISFGEDPKKLSTLIKTSSHITGIFWDSYRKVYYISIYKGTEENLSKEKIDFQWILQVCDHNFQLLQEYVMENSQYSSFCMFVTEKGLAIRKNNSSENIELKDKKEVFHVFQF